MLAEMSPYRFTNHTEILSHHGFTHIPAKHLNNSIYKNKSNHFVLVHPQTGVWTHHGANRVKQSGSGLPRLDHFLSRQYGEEKFVENRVDEAAAPKDYTKLDHVKMHAQIGTWKKELAKDRSLSPNSRESKLHARIFPMYDKATGKPTGQKEIDHVKHVANKTKDKIAAEHLHGVHFALTDEEGKFDAYGGNQAAAHARLKKAEKESPGVTDKIHPGLRAWIKSVPASHDDDDAGAGDMEESRIEEGPNVKGSLWMGRIPLIHGYRQHSQANEGGAPLKFTHQTTHHVLTISRSMCSDGATEGRAWSLEHRGRMVHNGRGASTMHSTLTKVHTPQAYERRKMLIPAKRHVDRELRRSHIMRDNKRVESVEEAKSPMHPIGTRVKLNPKIWKKQDAYTRGVVIGHEQAKDGLWHRVLTDGKRDEAKKHKKGDLEHRLLTKGSVFMHKELVAAKNEDVNEAGDGLGSDGIPSAHQLNLRQSGVTDPVQGTSDTTSIDGGTDTDKSKVDGADDE